MDLKLKHRSVLLSLPWDTFPVLQYQNVRLHKSQRWKTPAFPSFVCMPDCLVNKFEVFISGVETQVLQPKGFEEIRWSLGNWIILLSSVLKLRTTKVQGHIQDDTWCHHDSEIFSSCKNSWFISIQANVLCFGTQIFSWCAGQSGFDPWRKHGKQEGNFFMQSTHIVLQLDLIDPEVAHITAHISYVCWVNSFGWVWWEHLICSGWI